MHRGKTTENIKNEATYPKNFRLNAHVCREICILWDTVSNTNLLPGQPPENTLLHSVGPSILSVHPFHLFRSRRNTKGERLLPEIRLDFIPEGIP